MSESDRELAQARVDALRAGFAVRLREGGAPDAAAMNAVIEAMARACPAQYQWTYKRFKGQRLGEDLVNPYWPECY